MLWFNGVEAAVTIDNIELLRYGIARDDANGTITCWIPSVEGKAFCVKWGSGLRYHSTNISARVWIDGVPGDGMISQSCTCPQPFHSHIIDRVTVSSTAARPMLFSPVEYDEDRDPAVLEGSRPNLGEIVLTIHEAEVIRSTAFYNLGVANGAGSIHEGDKKLMTHIIRLGEEVLMPATDQSWYDTRNIRRVATFVFKYRPLEFLIAEGMAPANLPLRTVIKDNDNGDSRTEVEAQLQTIHKSIVQLDEKLSKKRRASTPKIETGQIPGGNPTEAEDDGYDTETEYEEARLHAMRTTVKLLRRRLGRDDDEPPAKKQKLNHIP